MKSKVLRQKLWTDKKETGIEFSKKVHRNTEESQFYNYGKQQQKNDYCFKYVKRDTLKLDSKPTGPDLVTK